MSQLKKLERIIQKYNSIKYRQPYKDFSHLISTEYTSSEKLFRYNYYYTDSKGLQTYFTTGGTGGVE